MSRQEILRTDELRYKEYFESKLAVELLNQAKHFKQVTKVNRAIIKFLTDNYYQVVKAIHGNNKIIADLREPFFGCLFSTNEPVSPLRAYYKMLSVLKAERADLSKIIQIHCIFYYRIYNTFEQQNDKNHLMEIFHPASIFQSNETRGREEKATITKSTKKLGIVCHAELTKLLGKRAPKHARAVDKFKPNYNSLFFQPAHGKITPGVAGASGHTANLMIGASLYGKLTDNELKEYAFACFVFLAAGGNHSFYEVMAIAKLGVLNVMVDDYAKNIPDNIKALKPYTTLAKEFPEFLSQAEEITNSASATSTL